MENEHTPNDVVEDPVIRESVAAGMAASDKKAKPSWLEKLAIIGGILVVLIGTAGGVLGAINTFNYRQQSKTQQTVISDLKKEQACTAILLETFEKDAAARNNIQAADREIIKELVTDVAKAKGQADVVTAAFDKFNRQSAINDAQRAKYPINPTITCENIATPKKPSSLPGIFPAPKTTTVTVTHATPTPVSTTVINQGSNTVVTRTQTAPQPTRTVTRTPPVRVPPIKIPPVKVPTLNPPSPSSLICQLVPSVC